jgi:hypothetical protein
MVRLMTNISSDENLAIEQRRSALAWGSYSHDTTPDIDRRRLAAAWSAPAWRKLWMAAEMSQTTRDLALAGLRSRFPDATEHELRFRLAQLLFGPKTANGICGQEPEEKDSNAA